MTPKLWNLAILGAMLSAVALIGAGFWLAVNLGVGLVAAGITLFACLLLVSRHVPTRGEG
jgi:hypothetical protein